MREAGGPTDHTFGRARRRGVTRATKSGINLEARVKTTASCGATAGRGKEFKTLEELDLLLGPIGNLIPKQLECCSKLQGIKIN